MQPQQPVQYVQQQQPPAAVAVTMPVAQTHTQMQVAAQFTEKEPECMGFLPSKYFIIGSSLLMLGAPIYFFIEGGIGVGVGGLIAPALALIGVLVQQRGFGIAAQILFILEIISCFLVAFILILWSSFIPWLANLFVVVMVIISIKIILDITTFIEIGKFNRYLQAKDGYY